MCVVHLFKFRQILKLSLYQSINYPSCFPYQSSIIVIFIISNRVALNVFVQITNFGPKDLEVDPTKVGLIFKAI